MPTAAPSPNPGHPSQTTLRFVASWHILTNRLFIRGASRPIAGQRLLRARAGICHIGIRRETLDGKCRRHLDPLGSHARAVLHHVLRRARDEHLSPRALNVTKALRDLEPHGVFGLLQRETGLLDLVSLLARLSRAAAPVPRLPLHL